MGREELGAQESAMLAAVGEIVGKDRRSSAYGVFNLGYGLSWFLGGALMGLFCDTSLATLVFFSVATQLVAVPVLLVVRRQLVHT